MRLISCRARPICLIVIYILLFVGLTALIYLFVNYSKIEISADYLRNCPYSTLTTANRIQFENSPDFLHHYPEFVCPQNFRNLADWIFGWPDHVFEEALENSMSFYRVIVPNLPEGSIIYVKTDSLWQFFTEIYPYLRNDFVLVTAQGDDSAPKAFLDYLTRPDSKIIHWFGQNGDINASTSQKFTHIPIGINCYEMAEAIRVIHRTHSDSRQPAVIKNSLDEPLFYIQPLDITKQLLNNQNLSNPFVLLNFDGNTDPTGIRRELWRKICHNRSTPFTICFDKPSGVQIGNLPLIYQRNRQYPFWLSPRGNGLDCHRTWEALYLDIIPIVWHSTLDPLYEDLPIIVIDHWNDVTEDFLRRKLREIVSKKLQQPPIYRYEKLRHTFWYQLILNKSRHSVREKHRRLNRCWRGKNIHR